MLSEESATGAHPAIAVRAMSALTRHAEAYEHSQPRISPLIEENTTFAAAAAGSAVASAENVRARAIVTLAGSGFSALHVSKRRPQMPIVALGSYEPTLRRLNVLHGVLPVEISDRGDFEAQLGVADAYLLSHGMATPGDLVVIVAALPLGEKKDPNTIRFHRVRAPA
jgi:pyruvate kinase